MTIIVFLDNTTRSWFLLTTLLFLCVIFTWLDVRYTKTLHYRSMLYVQYTSY